MNNPKITTSAEREISCFRTLNHPMITGMVDIIKDKDNFPCIIMEKREFNLSYIIKKS
jgi:serine/threonine protein kinase